MSYQFELGESVPEATVRIATEEIDSALAALRGGSDRVKAVHETRKSIKKLRALLRIFEAEMGRKAFGPENRFLRDAGRSLSSTRDADVLIESFDDIARRLREDDAANEGLIAAVRGVVFAAGNESTTSADATHPVSSGPNEAVAQAITMLEEAKERVQNWPIADANSETVIDGMRNIYRAGRRAMNTAYNAKEAEEHDDEFLHEWRKRVKDLWYHTLLIQPLWPKLLESYAEEAHKLADQLGEEHDLSILAATLRTRHQAIGDETSHLFLDEIAKRREKLRLKARVLGQRLYAEKPDAFAARIEHYWRSEEDV